MNFWILKKLQWPDRRWIPCSKRGSGHGGSQMSRSILAIKRPMMSTNSCTFGLGTCAELRYQCCQAFVEVIGYFWTLVTGLWYFRGHPRVILFKSMCLIWPSHCSSLGRGKRALGLSNLFGAFCVFSSTSAWVNLYTSLLPCRKKRILNTIQRHQLSFFLNQAKW